MIPSTISTLIAIPILGILVIVQSSIFSRIPLIQGTPDLVLLAILAWALQKKVDTAWQWCIIGSLMVTLVSALPLGAVFVGYGIATAIALALRRRIWQIPLLAMFIVTFFRDGNSQRGFSVGFVAHRQSSSCIGIFKLNYFTRYFVEFITGNSCIRVIA